MKSLANFILLLFLLFILVGCSSKNTNTNSNEYILNNEINSINIHWSFGTIDFVDSKEFKIQESSLEKTKSAIYEVTNETLTIRYDGKVSKDLIIFLDKEILYKNLNFISIFADIKIEYMKIQDTYIQSKIGRYLVEGCEMENFRINITCDDRIIRNKISTSKIDYCTIICKRVFETYITYNSFIELNLDFDYSYIFFKNNYFETLNATQKSGDMLLELNGNLGYTFNINCKRFSLDMETIGYNNKYIYKSGKYYLNLNGTGSFDIRRFF